VLIRVDEGGRRWMMVEDDGRRRGRVEREKSLYRMSGGRGKRVSIGGRVVMEERSTQVEKSEGEELGRR
jgi:hypothetical protein